MRTTAPNRFRGSFDPLIFNGSALWSLQVPDSVSAVCNAGCLYDLNPRGHASLEARDFEA